MDDFKTKDIFSNILFRAGRGKDEMIQLLGREISTALIAFLKKPLKEITENNKLQITFELIPKATKKKTSSKKNV